MAARHRAPRRPLDRLGRAVARRPVVALGVWAAAMAAVIAIALLGAGGQTLFDRLVNGAFDVAGEAADGEAVVDEETVREPVTLLVHGVELDDRRLAEAFAAAGDAAGDLSDRVTVTDPLALAQGVLDQVLPFAPRTALDDVLGYPELEALGPLIAADGRGVLLVASVEGEAGADPDPELVHRVIAALEGAAADLRSALPEATVEVGSSTQLVDSVFEQSQHDLERGEAVALPIALVIMLVVFGGFIAAGLPLLGAVAAIVGALGLLYATTFLMDVNTTVINVVTAVGLGLSIDYGLLMVSRFREEYRRDGPEPEDRRLRRERVVLAVGRTVDSAGRTALFSGTVFAIASAGLLLFEPVTVRALGLGALLVAAIGVISAVTLMPALIAVAGPRLVRPGLLTRLPGIGGLLSRFGDVAPEEGVFSRLTRRVQRAPALVALLSAGALVALGSPIASLALANTSFDAVPRSSDQYGYVTAVEAEFPDYGAPRIALVARDQATVRDWSAAVRSLDGVEAVAAPVERGEGWLATVQVEPRDGVRLVADVRAERPPGAEGWVIGVDASTSDLAASLGGTAPWAILMIALVTMAFLFLATGSFVIPLKALLASALSLSAAVGVLVWGFEYGNLAGIMGFDASRVYGVDVIVLLLALVFGFGLAMDYEMFILSRISEQAHAGVPMREAIARGLQRSGRIITSAALIIVVVFAGFATGDQLVIKGLGVALASAVLLDATVVRMLLVPALMTWLERVIYWAPRWARRLHARIGLSE